MRRRIDAHVVMEKIIPRITEEYRKLYDIPEDHESMAVFSAVCEDVMWLAVDDATKKAKIKVIQIGHRNLPIHNAAYRIGIASIDPEIF